MICHCCDMVGPPEHFQASLCNIVPHLQGLQTVSIQKVRIVTWPNLKGIVVFCTWDSPCVTCWWKYGDRYSPSDCRKLEIWWNALTFFEWMAKNDSSPRFWFTLSLAIVRLTRSFPRAKRRLSVHSLREIRWTTSQIPRSFSILGSKCFIAVFVFPVKTPTTKRPKVRGGGWTLNIPTNIWSILKAA